MPTTTVRTSTFGEYQGYTESLYDGYTRTSDYLCLADGTKLAYDLIRPTRDGHLPVAGMPVLFKYTPYGRAWTIFDKAGNNLLTTLVDLPWMARAFLDLRHRLDSHSGLFDPLTRTRWLRQIVKHGYAILVVDRPGTGASYGTFDGDWDAAARNQSEIIDWAASQSWSNGCIGMHGESSNAMVQLAAASTANKHLRAIFPASSQFDGYDSIGFPGGVFNKAFSAFFARTVPYLDNLATPVDADRDGAMLVEARANRGERTYTSIVAAMADYPFRDSLTADRQPFWDHAGLARFLDRINRSQTPIYLTVGWYDIFTNDAFRWYDNLSVPKRLTIRPLDHSGSDEAAFDLDYEAEARRWFDYWLKGTDNGIMAEPPIHYFTIGAPKDRAWQASDVWPPPGLERMRFHLGGGRLHHDAELATQGEDARTLDYTATTSSTSRWTAVNEERKYGDMRRNDAKGLTYTSETLPNHLELTGHTVIHLTFAVDAPDLDVFVYIEDVNASGRSEYVTEGNLRASHRTLGKAAFNNLGLPYPTHRQAELQSVGTEPVELIFSLLPTSYLFHAGHRLRVTITFADILPQP